MTLIVDNVYLLNKGNHMFTPQSISGYNLAPFSLCTIVHGVGRAIFFTACGTGYTHIYKVQTPLMVKVCLIYAGVKSLLNFAAASYAKNIEFARALDSYVVLQHSKFCAKYNFWGELALNAASIYALRHLGLIRNRGTVGLAVAGFIDASLRIKAINQIEEIRRKRV